MMNAFRLVLVACLFLLLQSCMNIATSGAQALYNQHSIKKNLNDQFINMQAFQAIHYKSNDFKDANISIATYNSEVLLAGEAPQAWQKVKAEQLIRKIPDVKAVYNLVRTSSPSSTMTRMSDAWITAKVKAKLIASDDLDATQIKVVTENGTVYLMGILQPDAADAATDIASNTAGVQRVVKIFSYITISKRLA
jgi:osmotically-inducible protein OsmY